MNIFISNISYENTNEKHQIDEEALFNQIKDIYSKGKKEELKVNDNTIWNDVKSMALLYRKLNGAKAYSIKSLDNILITTNKALAYACKVFNKNLNNNDKVMVPCMTDVFLGTLLWIQNPIKYDAYNEKQIIASCCAAIKPSNKALNTFYAEIDRLKEDNKITKEDYILTRNYSVVAELLSDEVMGEAESVDEQTVYEVIEEMKQNLTSEYKTQLSEVVYEKEKNDLENKKTKTKYLKTRRKLKNQLKKVAIKEVNAKVIWLFVIPIVIVLVETYLGIVDILKEPEYRWIRFGVCIVTTLITVIQIIYEIKKYKGDVIKTYLKKCENQGV